MDKHEHRTFSCIGFITQNKRYLAAISHQATSHSHLQAVQVNLWLGERDRGAAVEPEGPGTPVVSRHIPGTGVFAASVGSWDAVVRMAATDGRMGCEDSGDSAPPRTDLYSAHHLLPSV